MKRKLMDEPRRREKQEEEIVERTAPPGEVIYEAIYAEGEHELKRNFVELALSGLAAGLSMGFSMVAEAFLRVHLPAAGWTPLLTKLGYSLGFLIVILGRQQLFTENTLTVILPLLRKKKLHMLVNVGRLWGIVLVMNLIGTFLFALFVGKTIVFSAETHRAFAAMAETVTHLGFGTIFLRGILAGWLIALMIWLLPFAESARIWVIIALTYTIGLAGLPHVIAGSVETFYLMVTGGLSFSSYLGSFFLPAIIGNIIGGVALVAVGAHAEFFEAEKKG
ncbi:MAG TPA: formate/nitrite transporter family protein [Chthoniobacterales bacterium]